MVHNRTIVRLLVLSRHAEVTASPPTYLSGHSLVWNSRTSVIRDVARIFRKQARIEQTIHTKVIWLADFSVPIPRFHGAPPVGAAFAVRCKSVRPCDIRAIGSRRYPRKQ